MLCVKEGLVCTVPAVRGDLVESLCVRIKGKATKMDAVRVCYRSPSQDDDTET